MRSAKEIRFRLWQQFENLRLLAFPPALPRNIKVLPLPLPEPGRIVQALRNTQYAAQIRRMADGVLAHRIPLFDQEIDVGSPIKWRKDYRSGRSTGKQYFRFIPYLDFEQAGDHKMVWELNRHQHLVLLAQALLLDSKTAYLAELQRQLESWMESNPFLKGINFASALEVAFRVLSWLWLDHLVGPQLHPDFRQRLWTALLQHGYHLRANLSTYFSPNTHLLGEGVALHALGLMFPHTGWERLGHRILAEERDRQIQSDGSHFEQSTYYHVYALDFFLFYYLLAGKPEAFAEPLRKMAGFLESINGPAGLLNLLGDDDGGRFFHPYGDRAKFGRATLSTCKRVFPDLPLAVYEDTAAEQAAWWLGPAQSQILSVSPKDSAVYFKDSGLVSITRGSLHLLIDTGPFGPGGAGHSHSDTLSFTVTSGSRELLIDPGTFTYVADPKLRDQFRGSGYHNTIRVNRQDQADPVKPFRWENKPVVCFEELIETEGSVYVAAVCTARGISHRRKFHLVGSRILFILDRLAGPEGMQEVEQFWHEGPDREGTLAIVSEQSAIAGHISGWRSRCFGMKESSRVTVYTWRCLFPFTAGTALIFDGSGADRTLEVEHYEGGTRLVLSGMAAVDFPDCGPARAVPL